MTGEPDRDRSASPARPRRSDRRTRRRRRRRQGAAAGPGGRSRRTHAQRSRRRKARLRRTGGLLVALGIAVGAVAGAARLTAPRPDTPPAPATTPSPVDPGDPQPTVVLATFDDEQSTAAATRIVVLAYDRAREQGTIMLVPSSTVTDIPGHGLLEIGRAYGFGEGPLLDASLDNLLGVDLDHVVGISRQGWEALFDRVGGLTVDLPERLDSAGEDGGQVRFQRGEQLLDGPRAAELYTFEAAGESELDALARSQQVLIALLERLRAEPTRLDEVFDDGAPMLDTSQPGALKEMLALLADAHGRDAVTTVTLPVSPIGADDDEAYRVDTERVEALAADRFAPSRPADGDGAGRTLQILNGNGTPGIGQQVAERLVPAGYRVVLTGNADRFDHETTRIVIYDDSPAQLELARQIRDRLGVGEVELSGSPQSVVDVTIVVGRDFPP